MVCGMFYLDGDVAFIHSKHVKKKCFTTIILVVKCGLLKDSLRGVVYRLRFI